MRRVIAPIAAALLALTIAGPVAADPIVQQKQHPLEWVVTCTDPDTTAVPNQYAHGVPGWGIAWAPGDTPWLLMGYTATNIFDSSVVFVSPLHAAGLVGNGKLVGPCELTAEGSDWLITDGYFLRR